MDKAEAGALLTRELAAYRGRVFAELKGMIGENKVLELRGQSGTGYTIEVEVFWDDPDAKVNLRVLGSIDDGRLPGAMFPLCESFIVAPDGRFVDE